MSLHPCIDILKEWDIVGARQLGRNIAKDMGFGTVDQARIATAVSELARNIYLYANKGKICLEVINHLNKKGICLVAVDNGPGMDDLSQAMQDGYSTSNGLGAGLPGVKRLMDDFDINSNIGTGTEIRTIKWLR